MVPGTRSASADVVDIAHFGSIFHVPLLIEQIQSNHLIALPISKRLVPTSGAGVRPTVRSADQTTKVADWQGRCRCAESFVRGGSKIGPFTIYEPCFEAAVRTWKERRHGPVWVLFMRERANGLYGCLAHTLADTIVTTLYMFLISFAFAAIAYPMIGLNPGATHFSHILAV